MGVWTPGPGATAGADTFEGDATGEVVNGLAGNDTLYGRSGGDTLTGGDGDDRLAPGDDYVADTISGGAGYDILDYSEITEDGIYLSSADGGIRDTSAAADTFAVGASIDEVVLSGAGDFVNMSDTIVNAGDGDDFIIANLDVSGGDGRDFFAAFGQSMTINDFQVGVDFFTNGSIDSITVDGADTLINFNNGSQFRVVSVTGLTLGQWQAHTTSDWFIDNVGGNDVSALGFGAQYMFGAGGDDTLSGGAGDDSINGGPGADTLNGQDNDDRLFGGSGSDVLDGGTGVDLLDGGSGADALMVVNTTVSFGESFIGGDGDDLISVENTTAVQEFDFRDSTISGIEALDFASTTGSFSYVYIGAAQFGAGFSDTADIDGSALTDVFDIRMTTAGTVSVAGLTFSNWDALADLVLVDGSNGADIITGSIHRDVLTGFDGNDRISAGNGADAVRGFAGDDILRGGTGADEINGGDDFDMADYRGANSGVTLRLWNNTVSGGHGAGDTIISIEGAYGGGFADTLIGSNGVANTFIGGGGNDYLAGLSGNDTLRGDGGADTLDGGDGDDLLEGGAGADVMSGGVGFDTITYATSASGGTVRLWQGTGIGGDTFTDIESVIGSNYADSLIGANGVDVTLSGGGGNDFVNGLNGADTLAGGAGHDRIDGGASADVLTGNAGNDTFVFVAGQANGDAIADFAGNGASAGDVIELRGYGTAAAGATFVQLDATHWQITSADGLTIETITLSNGASVHATDIVFVGP